MIHDRAVDRTEKTLGFMRRRIFLYVRAMARGRSGCRRRSVGARRALGLAGFVSRDVGDGAGNSRGRFDLVQRVAIALEQTHRVSVQPENLVAIGRLQDAQQRLDVEAVGHDRQLGNRPLQPVDFEQVGRGQHGEPVERVVPEIAVTGQGVEWCRQRPDVPRRITMVQRRLQRLDEVTKADRILLVVRMLPMRRLVEREARRFMRRQQHGRIIAFERVHGKHPLSCLMVRLPSLSARAGPDITVGVHQAGRFVFANGSALARRAIEGRASRLRDALDRPVAARASLPFAVVDGKSVLEEAELAVCLYVVAERRAAGLDRVGDDCAHGLDQSDQALRRLSVCAHQRSGRALWREPCAPQCLAHVNVAQAGDYALIRKDRFERRGALREARRERLRRQLVAGRLEAEVGEHRMRVEILRRDQEHEAETARVVVDDARAAFQMEDHVIVRFELSALVIDRIVCDRLRVFLTLRLDPI